jgi:hypothetical protein
LPTLHVIKITRKSINEKFIFGRAIGHFLKYVLMAVIIQCTCKLVYLHKEADCYFHRHYFPFFHTRIDQLSIF